MEDDEIDLRNVLEMLRRQKRLIALTTLFCVGLAIAFLATATPIYTASTLIYVDPTKKDLLNIEESAGLPSRSEQSMIESEVEILRSDAIGLQTISEEGLVADEEFGPTVGLTDKIKMALGLDVGEAPAGDTLLRGVLNRLQSATDVNRRGQTFLITVSVSSEDPARAARIADARARVYIDNQVRAKIEGTLAARDVLQGQIDEARAELTRSEEDFDAFIARNLSTIADETGRDDLLTLEETLREINDARLQSRVALTASQEQLAQQDWSSLVIELESDTLADLERERNQIAQRLSGVVTGSEEAVDLAVELARIEEALEAEARAEIGGLRTEVADLQRRETRTRQDLRDILLQGEIPNDLVAGIYEIQQEATIARSQYQNLLSRLRSLEAQAAVQVADSRIVSQAIPPDRPSSPNTRLILLLAIVGGIALGIGVAILREYFVGGFSSPEQLEDALGAPVASIVPLERITGDDRTVADKIVRDPMSPYAEAIRRLRASLDQAFRKRDGSSGESSKPHTILVTSTLPEEGKSTTALALARTYAIAGKSVLLMDCDLRKPRLHTFIGADNTLGVVDYLRAEGTIQDFGSFSVEDGETGAVMVLGRGRSDQPTDQLLTSTQFERLMAVAREHFEIVIVDTSPLLPVVDARYILHHADAVVMCVRWAQTRQSDLRSVMASLVDGMRNDAHLFGLMSHSEGPTARRYYRYGYY